MNRLLRVILFVLFSFVAAAVVDVTLIFQFSLITYSITLILYFVSGLFVGRNVFPNLFFLFPLLALSIFAVIANPLTFPVFSPITFVFATLAFILGLLFRNKKEKNNPLLFYPILLITLISFVFMAFYFTPHFMFDRNRQKISNPSPIYNELNFTNLDGSPFEIGELKNKIVFIDNWFLSCYQCNLKLPSLQQLFENAESDSTVIIISVVNGKIDSLNEVISFANKHKEYKFKILYDKENSLGNIFKVDGYPIEIIIDKSGLIRERHDGFNKDERLVYVNQTLKKINSYK